MAGNLKIESNGTGGKVMLDTTDISNMLMSADIAAISIPQAELYTEDWAESVLNRIIGEE